MNSHKLTISFFCPAYHDEKNLPILIPKTIKVLRKIAAKFEIVIVEDGSPDKTAQVADFLAKKYPGYVRVIHHKTNKGYGAALKRGFKEANKYDYVFYTDGDNQFNVEDLGKMVPFVPDFDVVIGYRKKRALSRVRLLQTIIYNFIVRVLFGVNAKDINCSMKLIKTSFIKRMNIRSQSPFIDAELLITLTLLKAKIKEVSVSHNPRLFGEASGGKFSVIAGTVRDMYTFWQERQSNKI